MIPTKSSLPCSIGQENEDPNSTLPGGMSLFTEHHEDPPLKPREEPMDEDGRSTRETLEVDREDMGNGSPIPLSRGISEGKEIGIVEKRT